MEVVNGSQAGTFTTAGADGQFSLSGAFDADSTFRASQDGYVAATQGWNCSNGPGTCPANGAKPWLRVLSRRARRPCDIGGSYTLTFIADSACSDIPSELRTRTYGATIAPSHPGNPLHTSFDVAVSGAPFLGSFRSFGVGVAGDYLGFWLDGGHDPPLVEQVAQNSYLAFSGVAAASVGTALARSPLRSTAGIEYCVMPSPMGAAYNCGTSNTTGDPIPGQAITRAHCKSEESSAGLDAAMTPPGLAHTKDHQAPAANRQWRPERKKPNAGLFIRRFQTCIDHVRSGRARLGACSDTTPSPEVANQHENRHRPKAACPKMSLASSCDRALDGTLPRAVTPGHPEPALFPKPIPQSPSI